MDPEMENLPTDYTTGTDFRLTKTQKGQYADYSTSNWARRERGLSEDELAAVSTHGLFTLNDYLPKRPSADGVKVIYDMFQASVDGELYDPAKWSDHYRPYGVTASSKTETVQVAQTETVAVTASDTTESKTEAVVETVSEEKSGNNKSADEILAMIRDRKKNVTESA
jgi:hypothetical protein